MRLPTERRAGNDHVLGDRITKQIIVYTVCGIAVMVTLCVCRMAMRQIPIPDQLDRIVTLVVGGVLGWLGKTGVDAAFPASGVPVKVNNAPNDPVPTTETKTATDNDVTAVEQNNGGGE